MNEGIMEKDVALETILTTALKLPGVRVDRNDCLIKIFSNEDVDIQELLELGPVAANIPHEKITQLADKQIFVRTGESSLASFVSGIPGGLAMAATIPLDLLQFFATALKLAQELSYIYGATDIWQNNDDDNKKIINQMLLYCGVMFGVSGAVSGVRLLSVKIAQTTLKKLPQKALTKGFWYPILKQIGKAIGVKITKSSVAKGISKAIPIVGGIISGSLNFASMMPMAKRLQKTLDSAVFDYSDEKFQEDIIFIENISNEESEENTEYTNNKKNINNKAAKKGKNPFENISGFFNKNKPSDSKKEDVFESIKKLSELKENGIITQEDFDNKKEELLSKI